MGSENIVLNCIFIGGMLFILGFKNGYEILYVDNGGENRNFEKILIVVGDGIFIFSYVLIERSNRLDFINWVVMNNMIVWDIGDLFKNFEIYFGNILGVGFSYFVVYFLEFNCLEDMWDYNYCYGEVKEGDDKVFYWVGIGVVSNGIIGELDI